jgi:hypothetical protein
VATPAAAVFTCPPDRTALIKWLSLIGLTAPGVTITATLNAAVAGNRLGIWDRDSAGAGQIPLGWVLQEGETLLLAQSVVGLTVTFSLHGALLMGDPS